MFMEYKFALAVTTAIIGGLIVGNFANALFLAPLGIETLENKQSVLSDKGKMYGIVQYVLKDQEGNIKYQTTQHNRITDGGEDIIQKIFSGGIASTSTVDTICVGTGGATADSENGAGAVLVTPVTGGGALDVCKEDATVTIGTETGATPQTVVIDATWTGGTDFAAATTVDEAVTSDTDTAGAPSTAQTFSRQVFTGIPVANGDSLTVKWTITISEP